MTKKLKRMATLALAAAMLQPHLAAADERLKAIREKWTPGTPMLTEFLPLYPCHSEELPCGQLPPPAVQKVSFKGALKGDAKRGEKIALDVRWGNCATCHSLPGHKGGTVGPSLEDYASRAPSLEYTYQRIWDTRVFNPDAHMPLFGTNSVLTEDEILDVMVFIHQR
jgi:sulfur-oxidizing protein SoxX